MTHIHFNIVKMMTHIMIHIGFHAFRSGQGDDPLYFMFSNVDCLPNDPHWVCL